MVVLSERGQSRASNNCFTVFLEAHGESCLGIGKDVEENGNATFLSSIIVCFR